MEFDLIHFQVLIRMEKLKQYGEMQDNMRFRLLPIK